MNHDRTERAPGASPMTADEARRERRRIRERVVIDRRTRAARRLEELEAAFLAEIVHPTLGDRVLAKRAATLALQSEQSAAAAARGAPQSSEDEVRLSNALTRTMNALAKRSAPRKKQTPRTFAEILASRGGAS